ncbi:MAG: glycoside hydrolase family 57 protein [Thermodesulfobacteriota bacterium]|nr:MAG: glycoside hydrolase family 57 protein [Thermodesulfobacteriota bacterium]
MDNRLNVAFLWHMHQPLYKDPITGEYTLPWVLFHATKDYYDMAAILEEFPEVHQTFNLVPCLIEQLQEYGSGAAKDRYLAISKKRAADLTPEERLFILRNFFQANAELMIKPFRRYWELFTRRGTSEDADEVAEVLRYFKEQDFLDLQVFFNLVWVDPHIRSNDPVLKVLCEKGGGYNEEDKRGLFACQTESVNKILPLYKSLMEKGIIEVSTTPYYHPIMPLLCDSHSAKVAMPDAVMPKKRFKHPEDALAQLTSGISLYEKTFGRRPAGVWPSEGSVSMDMLPIVAGQGVKWLATDEEILANSLHRPIRRDEYGHALDPFLYRPYAVDAGGAGGAKLSMLFRDHVLSDLIGFDYAKMDPGDAARDMVSRLEHIQRMVERPGEHIVSIILDGENAWEHFINDGRDFLVALYSALSGHPLLRCVTVNEFLEGYEPREELKWVYPGSWISHNFKIWIGHVEDNTAWDYIAEARGALVDYQASLTPEEKEGRAALLEQAWDAIYAAQGSDWFWWYGEEHSTMSDEYFDDLFRSNIKKVYTLIGMTPPDGLDIPISSEEKGYEPPQSPSAFLKPVLDGEVTNYFEWLGAGEIQRQYYGSAMHREVQRSGLIDCVRYGFSKERLFFRFDYIEELVPYDAEWSLSVNFLHPLNVHFTTRVKGTESTAVFFEKDEHGRWERAAVEVEIASGRVVELSVPLSAIGVGALEANANAKAGDEIRLFLTIEGAGRARERWPVKGFLIFKIPGEDFEELDWMV